ncbi:MAG: hypothetical protein Q9M11_05445 [Mariprofundaceae bacterium]|nr:hypothetical protein [Mariprofundaceae bacterium]
MAKYVCFHHDEAVMYQDLESKSACREEIKGQVALAKKSNNMVLRKVGHNLQ